MKPLKVLFNLLDSLLLLLIFTPGSAQEKTITKNSFFTAGYNQINEGANFGLIFRGPVLNYGIEWNSVREKRYLTYEYDLGVGILFSKQIPALGFYLKPIDLGYLLKIPFAGKRPLTG